MVPAVGCRAPATRLNSVVLPAVRTDEAGSVLGHPQGAAIHGMETPEAGLGHPLRA